MARKGLERRPCGGVRDVYLAVSRSSRNKQRGSIAAVFDEAKIPDGAIVHAYTATFTSKDGWKSRKEKPE